MTNLRRRLQKLEAALTDPTGLVPHSQRWLEYWDRQYYLYMSGQDKHAVWLSSIEALRAVLKHADENPASLVAKHLESTDASERAGGNSLPCGSAYW